MSRTILSMICVLMAATSAAAFTTTVPRRSSITFVQKGLFMADDDSQALVDVKERGVSMDQDGKSNVWAVEPKMEVDTKSAEEKMTGNLIAVGGFAAFAVAAGFILTNLPDPNTF